MQRKCKTSHRAKLTIHDVRLIRQMAARGVTQAELASRFHISQPSVCNLLAGRTYKYV